MSQGLTYCTIDLIDQDPVPPDDHAYILSIAANRYELLAHGMREGTLSKIVGALNMRQARPDQVILGEQANGIVVLDVAVERVCIELRRHSETNRPCIAVRLVLADEEIEALLGAAQHAASLYDE